MVELGCSFYQPQIFVYRRTAQTAQSRKFAYIDFSSCEVWIMLVENRRDILTIRWPASYTFPICPGVLHAAADSLSDHGQFQLRKHAAHLNEGLAHGIDACYRVALGRFIIVGREPMQQAFE